MNPGKLIYIASPYSHPDDNVREENFRIVSKLVAKLTSEGKAIDVGVDDNNLAPLSLNEIMGIMSKQPISSLKLPKDHHVEEM